MFVSNLVQFINQKLIESRFLTIRDLIDSNAALREIREPLCSTHSTVDHLLFVSLANALPEEWRRVFKTNETPDPLNQEFRGAGVAQW